MTCADTLDLFDGPRRDEALARQAGAEVRALPGAEPTRDAIVAMHADVRREWVNRARDAMVSLWHERERANLEQHHGQAPAYVTADDASRWAELAQFSGDKRCFAAVFVTPKGMWRALGTTTSKRRNATRVPMWALVVEGGVSRG